MIDDDLMTVFFHFRFSEEKNCCRLEYKCFYGRKWVR